MRIIVVGAGGHSRSVCDIIHQAGEHEIVGLIDPDAKGGIFDIPLLGGDELLPGMLSSGWAEGIFIAIGNNGIRRRITQAAKALGYKAVNAVHPRAVISPHADLGDGICVMAGAILNAGAVIGDGCILNTNCSVDHDVSIGAFCHIAPGVAICGDVCVGEESFLGVGSRVIDKVRIGPCTVIGGGGVVIEDMDGYCTAVGVPVKIIKRT